MFVLVGEGVRATLSHRFSQSVNSDIGMNMGTDMGFGMHMGMDTHMETDMVMIIVSLSKMKLNMRLFKLRSNGSLVNPRLQMQLEPYSNLVVPNSKKHLKVELNQMMSLQNVCADKSAFH